MKLVLTALCSPILTLAAFVVGAGSSAGQALAPGVEIKISG